MPPLSPIPVLCLETHRGVPGPRWCQSCRSRYDWKLDVSCCYLGHWASCRPCECLWHRNLLSFISASCHWRERHPFHHQNFLSTLISHRKILRHRGLSSTVPRIICWIKISPWFPCLISQDTFHSGRSLTSCLEISISPRSQSCFFLLLYQDT